MDIETGTVDVGDAQIYYRAMGAGDPLLVVHNFGTSGERWMPWVGPFAETRRVVVAHARGHGRSEAPTGEWSHRQSSEDMATLMERLGHPVFDAIGCSSGGMALMHMAVRQPERLRAMVVIGATTHFTERSRAFQAAAFEAPVWKGMRVHSQSEEQFDTLRGWFRDSAFDPDDMAFTPHHLSMIRARTLVMQGDRDVFFPPEIALEMFRGIPDSTLCVLPMGHIPREDEHELVVRIASDFFDKPAD